MDYPWSRFRQSQVASGLLLTRQPMSDALPDGSVVRRHHTDTARTCLGKQQRLGGGNMGLCDLRENQ
jgi:hypothetical protein